MFGSTNPFGQSSSSPFGSQSVFGSNNANNNNNPFAPKPFGSTSPFGSQTGGSIFGGTSTGVFGAPQSSTPTFGASSTPAFGASSTPAFGASSTPAFGASSSFGGSSVFGQKPAFGGFGSTPTQTSPFGSTVQQTQSAFGSNLFGSSTPFGQPSQPAFGSTSTPAFGMTGSPAFGSTTPAFGASTPAFGATSTPAFGSTSTPAFGSTSTSAFGTGTTFGNTGSAFGQSSTPAFGSSSTNAFGAPAFGSTSTPLFGATTSAFGASSSPSFSFGSSPSFGQTNSAFGSTPFGASSSPFGAQSSAFGSQTPTPAFGSTGFGQTGFGGQQRGGTRVQSYTPTAEVDGGTSTQAAGKLESISAMPVYKDKSHEELRWEDYQLGDKGGPNPATQPTNSMGFGQPAQQSNPFGASPTFGQTSANPFSSTTPSNPFGQKTSTFGSSPFGTPTTAPNSSPFGSSTTANPNPFGGATSSTPSIFGQTPNPNPFGASTSSSIFGQTTTPAFSSPSIFGNTSTQNTSSPFGNVGLNIGNTQSAPLFQSTTPALGQQTNSPFGQTTSAFGQQTSSPFGQTSSPFGQTSQPSLFSTPSSGFGFATSSSPSLFPSSNQPSFSSPFQTAQPAQTSGGFSFNNNFTQTQPSSAGFGSTFLQPTQNAVAMQPTPVSNPFGTLPAMPQMSIGGRSGSSPTVQYGISSMPVTDKPAPVRVSSLLTTRHVSQRRVGLPSRKYNPKNDAQRVSFFSDEEEEVQHSTPKADALFIPRENPRALVIRPTEKWPVRATPTPPKDTHENGSNKPNGSVQEIKLTTHRAGEAAIVYEHGADVEALMPKLKHADYYTEPKIQELAAKERAEPGYTQRVKDFVVGRTGYGSIRFIGETDVRRLDLESIVQFNNREVIVYLDDSKKPAVGQGLNKAAEVTLLNIKCMDKKSGKQYVEGAKVEKYKEMLMKKAGDQGAEFVSYDPVKGEWKFKVEHFSVYCFESEDDDEDEEDDQDV